MNVRVVRHSTLIFFEVFVALITFFIPPFVTTMPFSWYMAVPLLLLPTVLCVIRLSCPEFRQFYGIYGATKFSQGVSGFFFNENCLPLLAITDVRQIFPFIIPVMNVVVGMGVIIGGLKDANNSDRQR